MEKENNVIGIEEHKAFRPVGERDKSSHEKIAKATNPITGNFAKFFNRGSQKCSPNDILR